MIQSDASSIANDELDSEQEHGERNSNSELFHNNFPLSRLSLSSGAQQPLSDAPSDVDAQPSESNIENDEENLRELGSDDILNAPISIALPPQSEPSSARIQMIERERQARLERERAKIKRHFVLNREREAEDQAFEEADIARIGSEEHLSDSTYSIGEMIIGSEHDEPLIHMDSISNHMDLATGEHDGNHHGNNEHIASDESNLNIHTVGVNSTLSEDDQQQQLQQQQQQLGYTMELFLKEGNPSQHTIHEDNSSNNSVPSEEHSNEAEIDIRHDMNDPVMRNIGPDLRSQIGLDTNHSMENNLAAVSNMSVISHDNMSLEANRPSSDISSPTRFRSDSHDLETNHIGREFIEDHPTSANYPRLERLTEAEVFDLHDIDYASVGNMPPRSVRDERHLPEVVAGMSNFSNATQTTLLDSESSVHSRASSLVDMHNSESSTLHEVPGDEGPTHSVALDDASPPNNNALSPISTTSVLGHQNDEQRSDASITHSDLSDRKLPALLLNTENDVDCSFEYDTKSIEETEVIKTHSTSAEHFQNRTIRPGIGDSQLRTKRSNYAHRRAQTTPNFPSFVDDFDYCKYNDDSIPSRVIATSSMQNMRNNTSRDHYGSIGDIADKEPLLKRGNVKVQRSYDDMVDSVFSSVRSVSTEDIQAEIDECEDYASSSVARRAFNGRIQSLIITIALEIPVLLMIAGGSDRLCELVGRKKYQLLLAFLPISSSISGHCGIQASELASRAVAHLHVSKHNYIKWLMQELQVSIILGCMVGLIVGAMAFYASQFDLIFGFIIFLGNLVNILSAGLVGTLAPLISTFIWHRDSSKWRGPVQSIFHDIVGTFMMVIFSYHLVLYFNPSEMEPKDVCSVP